MTEPHRTTADPYGRLDVGQLFGQTFSTYFRNFLPLTAITLLVLTPTIVWTLVILSDITLEKLAAGSDSLTVYTWGGSIVGLVLQTIGTAAIVYAVFRLRKHGRLAGVGQSLRVGLVSLPTLLGIALVVGLLVVVLALPVAGLALGLGEAGVFLGVMLLLPVLILIYVGLFVTVPVVVVERAGVMAALRRSWALTEGQRWRILGLVLLFWAVYLGCAIVILAFSIMGGGMRDPLVTFKVWQGATMVLNPVFAALTSVAPTLTFFDLKLLKEGVGTDELEVIFE